MSLNQAAAKDAPPVNRWFQLVVGIVCVTDRDELLLVTEQGQIIRMKTGDLRPMGRDTQGVKLMDLAEGDRLVSMAKLTEIE